MTCYIIDDEPLAVKLLESFVAKTSDLTLLGSFTDSIEALDAIKIKPADLLFLDIQMPDINGMELAHTIDNKKTRIIFTTAFKDYAFESYEVNALDFLLKPIRYAKFQASIEKARSLINTSKPQDISTINEKVSQMGDSETKSLFLKIDGELRQLQVSDIIYIEGMKDYLKFYIKGERSPWVTHLTMQAAEEMLPSTQFMRINRSYIISLSNIRSIDRNDCVYIGEQIIRVTDAYLPKFKQYLEQKLPK